MQEEFSGQEELLAWARARPLRVAFLVERGDHSGHALDGIFADSYGRWGGRFSLVVPCIAGRIDQHYWQWLRVFDPDIVYCYGKLADDEVLKVHEVLNPSELLFHKIPDDEAMRLHLMKPEYKFSPMSSLSVLFSQARLSPKSLGTQGIKLLSIWHTEEPSRFFLDNFGSYFHSVGSSSYPHDARSVGSLVHILSPETIKNARAFGIPNDLPSAAGEMEGFAAFAGLKVGSMSILSALNAPRVEIRDWQWSTAFNLIVGDSFEDRVLFWNSRLLTPAWLDDDLCCFRITMDQARDEVFVGALANLLNKRNRVNNGSGGAPQVCVRSSSHSKEELDEVGRILREQKVWSGFVTSVVSNEGRVDPAPESLESSRDLAEAAWVRREWHEFSWRKPIAKVPRIEPSHLTDVPSGQAFALGAWLLDVSFEYDEERPRASNLNRWKIPSRFRMADAFGVKREEISFPSYIPGWNRRSKGGNLSVFSSRQQLVSAITVPTIELAAYWALCRSRRNDVVDGLEHWPEAIFFSAEDSNEAPHLKGVTGMAGGFSEARSFLLHPFLKRVFADLGGAPSLADHDVAATANSLVKRRKQRPIFDLKDQADVGALSALIVKAAQSLKAPRSVVSLQDLESRWDQHRKAYWEAIVQRPPIDPSDNVDWEERERRTLYQCLTRMRSLRMMFQGYPWTCVVCQHKNWVDFQALAPELVCDVCRSRASLPIGIPWHFRPNEFLIRSLQQHSVLSVLWTLSAIHHRSMYSFAFRGPCALRNSDSKTPDHEIDLLVLSDGELIMCEVKTAWRSVQRKDVSDFVALAKRVRPDLAMFAVMENGTKFSADFSSAEIELRDHGVRMELLTPAKYQKSDYPSLPY